MIRNISIALICLLLLACEGQPDLDAPSPATKTHDKTLDDFKTSDWNDLSDSYTNRVRAASEADEAFQRYALSTKYGTNGDICHASMVLTTAYAEAGDEENWKKWDRKSRKDCLPDSQHWEKREESNFPKHDDRAITQDPKLKSEAAEYQEYLRVATGGARRWRLSDANSYADSYQHDLSGGTFDDRCTHAFNASSQYLEALDEANYAKWKGIQKADCTSAGDTIATRAASSGAY
ncbi:hypothetical protein [Rhodanobacter sp. C03]|uniref:hypothetical protein n=1 Tax=Rhodanobacter sp. C03 TaxID=1945858 RepID=UPI000984C05A|nr:hypothetical protein [Rhodanobacter sp. C03]OOG60164.1 hypothetical protein B0E48_05270 [Rhodanobacter sp. C03]